MAWLLILISAFCCVFLVVGLIVVIFGDMRRHLEFLENYPPITDEEFMEKLPQGTSRDIALRVRAIVAEQAGVERERVYPETKFIDLVE